MIRRCTEADIPFVMELGKRFADDAGVTDQIGWDDASVEGLLRVMMDHVLLRGDRSIIGGLVFPHPFNQGRKIFQEMFWRSEHAGEGIRLLDAAEKLAKELGATRSLMLTVATMPGAERIYERRGYAPAERTFIKEL